MGIITEMYTNYFKFNPKSNQNKSLWIKPEFNQNKNHIKSRACGLNQNIIKFRIKSNEGI